VITSPLSVSSAITLSPASASVVKGSPVTLSGTVSVGSGTAAAGTAVSVSRLNPDGTTTQIAGTTTDAQGHFTVTDDTASATGSYTYTASTTLSLSGPATERPVLRFSIPGKLSYLSGTPATGTAITVTRKGPSATTAITGIKTGANGAFSIPQYIGPLGAYTYTASVPATSTVAAASTTFKLTVAKAAPTLTVTTPAATALYNATINVTAHLGSTATNRTVSIYAQLVGNGSRKLLKAGKVNGSGNLAVSYPKATRNVIFTATFTGDAQYNSRSVSKRIGVNVRIAATYTGSTATATYDGATYRVYHHTGTLVDKIAVTPNKRGECVKISIEALSGTQWVSGGDTPCFGLTSTSGQVLDLQFASVPYGHYRMEVLFQPSSKDVTNVAYHTGWFYFQSEK
jgi:5-hydroxyisourate hydrolase-like protein (transthyretin family)